MQVAAIGAGGDVLGAAKSAGHLLCMVSNVSADRSSKLCETKGNGDQRTDCTCEELSSVTSFSSQAFSITLIICSGCVAKRARGLVHRLAKTTRAGTHDQQNAVAYTAVELEIRAGKLW